MNNIAFSGKRFWLIYLLGVIIALLIVIQICFAILWGGWLANTPKVEIQPQNCFNETLRVVADIDFAPYSSVLADGSYNGHDIECINDVANRMGINLDLRLMTWNRAVDAVKNGDADVIMGLESISNRNDGLMITSIVADDAFVVYGKEPISGVEELKQGRIATIAGKTEVDIYGIEEHAITYDTYSEELQALEQGDVDYAVMRASVAKMLIHQNGYSDLLQVFDMMDSGLGFGVREGEALLATRLDRVIREMVNDGTLADLQSKWLTTYVSTKSLSEVFNEYRFFYLITTFALILCAVGIVVLIQQARAAVQQAQAEQELAMSRATLAAKEAELADSSARIMLSQIQPHFLYNALGTIGQLSRRDSAQAADAIDTFARYLRTNLESVESTKQVSFSEELQHVKTYLWLEQMRFGEALNVRYNIQCEDFHLPPLTVQPIVENAVKHGLGQKEEGGTIIVRSQETEDCWIIGIEDDGVGFDEEIVLHDSRTHIGIENVRRRLQYMCRGTLEIESAPGKGTVASIRIPKL